MHLFKLAKCADIFFVSTLYFVLGCILSICINSMFPVYDHVQYVNRSSFFILLEVLLHILVMSVGAYFMREIIEYVNVPWDGMVLSGIKYNHAQIREVHGGILNTFAMLILLKDFKSKTIVLITRALE